MWFNSAVLRDEGLVNRLSLQHPKSRTGIQKYGTAGFRDDASRLDAAVFRMGLFACVLSLCDQRNDLSETRSKVYGIMITASHNKASDNGIKLIDSSGRMMLAEHECNCDALVAQDDDMVCAVIDKMLDGFNSVERYKHSIPRVFIGRDTRSSGPRFNGILCSALNAMKCEITDYGMLTTPQLHWLVHEANNLSIPIASIPPNLASYHRKHTDYFQWAYNCQPCPERQSYRKLIVDCSNGVGSFAMDAIQYALQPILGVLLINTVTRSAPCCDELNHLVGADYVHTSGKLPNNAKEKMRLTNCRRCCSLDGDADRIIYSFWCECSGQTLVCDGDRILCLWARMFKRLLHDAQLEDISVGIVQTRIPTVRQRNISSKFSATK